MSNYNSLKDKIQRIADIAYTTAVLSWDQETYMPEKGAAIRGRQLATLSGLAHSQFTAPEIGEELKALATDSSLTEKEKKNIELLQYDYSQRTKLSSAFVEEMSMAISAAFNAWQEAKEHNNFSLYAPHLDKLLQLKFKEAEMMGYTEHPYDVMLNAHERGLTTKAVKKLFEEVKVKLVPFVKQIKNAKQVDDSFMFQKFNKDKQYNYTLDLLKDLNFDYTRGRQDVSSHPFSISFNSHDVRVTTRINENDLQEVIWSTIHECGHALYEQGLPIEEYGMPLSEAVSLGIHESQSRLWENNVGRSLNFWKKNYKALQDQFPQELGNVSVESFYQGMNKVESSLIRTNADELTYHFHVMIRFECELALFEKRITVYDLPKYWNDLYRSYLDIEVPSDSKGVLQDVHWSHGSFGYFPTYSLGSFYAAQFYAQAKKEIPDLEQKIASGDNLTLLNWLRSKIHQFGRHYSPDELSVAITGESLNFDHFMSYAEAKYKDIYSI